MYRVIDSVGKGKTKKLLNYAKDNQAIMVCANPRAMVEKSHSYGIVGVDCISYEEFYLKRGMTGTYVIDELENLINFTTNGRNTVIGYSLTNED